MTMVPYFLFFSILLFYSSFLFFRFYFCSFFSHDVTVSNKTITVVFDSLVDSIVHGFVDSFVDVDYIVGAKSRYNFTTAQLSLYR